jgi:hypothetical protein
MPTKRYKSSLTEQIIELKIPDKLASKGIISFGDNKVSEERRGMFGFELSGETLVITDIFTPGGLKITDLFILEAVNYYKTHGLHVTSVVANSVLQLTRGFYLQNGFLPTIDNMEMNNKYVPPPDNDINFTAHFFHTKILGGVIYKAKNGQDELRSVTHNGFDMRIEAGRNAPHWKMSDSFLEKLVKQQSSLIWKEDVIAPAQPLNRVPPPGKASNFDALTRTLNTRVTPTSISKPNDKKEGVVLDSQKNPSMTRK